MPVRSRRLGDTSVATTGGGATTTIFTVPADRTAIVKDIRAWLSAATTPPIKITFVVLRPDATTRSVDAMRADAAAEPFYSLPADAKPERGPWIVLHEGDALRVSQPANCTVQTYVSGTLLDGDPA